METHNDRSNEQRQNFSDGQTTHGHTVSGHNEERTAERLNAQRRGEESDLNQSASANQDQVDAQRGDNDDFTSNGLDEGNTMGNDDDPADARESGTK